MISRLRLPLVLCVAIASGCASAPAKQPATPAVPNGASDLDKSAIQAALAKVEPKRGDYRISPADLLRVTVYQQPDLGGEMRVRQNGSLTLHLIGNVDVGGKSIDEAQSLIAEKFKEFIKNPQVGIFVKEYSNKKIFIMGEVKNPGSIDIPVESKLTVLEAVTLAGGFTAIAAPDRTRVIRGTGDKSQIFVIDVSAITKRGEKEKDITLEPSDVVFVPQSLF